MKTLIIGLGNPLLGDDGVGIAAVNGLKGKLHGVDLQTMNASGFEVAEKMLGYDRVIVVDAIAGRVPGRVHTFTPAKLKPTLHFANPHDMNLQTAIQWLGSQENFPGWVKFVAVEIVPENEFREGLSERVRNALPEVERRIMNELKGGKRNANK
ncbi:MAG: hydrogenase maturation protease [Thermoplasmata archaeon]|nr:hydrogenase maturation protease [Thermoplasmata archaeon]